MTDQPYEGYGAQDPYHRQRNPQQQTPQPVWPGQPAHDDPYAAQQHTQQHTQQWQGQTWETSVQPPASADETAYLPPQAYQQSPQQYAQPQPQQYAQPQPQPQQYAQPQTQQYAQHQYVQPQQYPESQQYPEHRSGSHPSANEPPAPPEATRSEPVGAPDYGPATLAGNTRVTDAQRARAEGRSPIIEPGMQPAGLTALLGLLLAGAAAVGSYALLLPLVVLQALTAAGWFRLNGMWPARQGIALGFLGALVADAAMLASGRSPAAILGALGVWVLLALVLQLRSHADPDERMYGLMATVAAAALAILAGGYLAAGADAVTVGGTAVAVAVVARALPLPTAASVVVALLAAAGAGIAAGALTDFGTSGALLGAGAAVCALIGHRVASYDYPSRFVHFTAGVALPLSAAAPAVWVLGRALG
ncbi:hypothetical protein [Streptomyces poriticola]|uniref:hypothetical protein n=1 Tax=Streptomyces poriticola TaxID=3120506 RepID=UPI002FCDEEDE